MRFPDVLTATQPLLERYPVLAALPLAATAPDALLRYVILRCGKGSPFHAIGDLVERKKKILSAIGEVAPESVAGVARYWAGDADRLAGLLVAYLKNYEHAADLGLLVALEEKHWQDIARLMQPIDEKAGDTKDGLKDDAVLRAFETRTKFSVMMPAQLAMIQSLRAAIFAGDDELAAMANDENAGVGFSEQFAQRPEFVGK